MKQIVQKSTPEESAVIQNLASLIQQLQAMGVGDQSFDQGPADQGMAPPAPEQDTFKSDGANPGDQPMPQNTQPQENRRPMMKQPVNKIAKSEDQDEDDLFDETVEKAGDSTSEGVTATDDTEEKLEDDLPETTKENLNEIKKALNAIGYTVTKRKTVQKSMGVSGGNEIAELRNQVSFLASTLGEMLEGMNVAKAATFEDPADPMQVRKSQRPNASYSGQADIGDVLKALVAEIREDKSTENAEANPWNQTNVVRKSMRSFTENLQGIAGGLWPK